MIGRWDEVEAALVAFLARHVPPDGYTMSLGRRAYGWVLRAQPNASNQPECTVAIDTMSLVACQDMEEVEAQLLAPAYAHLCRAVQEAGA